MNKSLGSYIVSMLIIVALIALLPSMLSMFFGSAMFAFIAIGMPFGIVFGISVLSAVIFSLFSADFLTGLIIAFSFIIPGWIMGFCLRKRKSLSVIFTGMALARGGLLLAYFDRISGLEKVSFKEIIVGDLPQNFIQSFKTAGFHIENEDLFSKFVDEMFTDMIPASIAISAISFAFLSLACMKFLTRRTPIIFAGVRKFSDIKMDVSFTLSSVIIVFGAFLESDLQIILLNCAYVLLMIYTVAGFAFIYRFLRKAFKMPILSFAITAVIGAFSFGLLLPLMGIVGSFIKTDYDKKIKEENRKDDEI